MSTIMDGLGTEHRIERVNTFARAFQAVLAAQTRGSLSIEELLRLAADSCNVVPAQMRYALSFADAEGYVDVNFGNDTVASISSTVAA